MHWIYILKYYTNIIYIGETKKLYTKLSENINIKNVKKSTGFHKPCCLLGIYKLKNNIELLRKINSVNPIEEELFNSEDKKNATILQNEITEMYMKSIGEKWKNVYGGKYFRHRPKKNPTLNQIFNRPYCHCRLPADIYEFKNKKYWRCCKKNTWEGLNNFLENFDFPVLQKCNYYKEYKENEKYEYEDYNEQKYPKNFAFIEYKENEKYNEQIYL